MKNETSLLAPHHRVRVVSHIVYSFISTSISTSVFLPLPKLFFNAILSILFYPFLPAISPFNSFYFHPFSFFLFYSFISFLHQNRSFLISFCILFHNPFYFFCILNPLTLSFLSVLSNLISQRLSFFLLFNRSIFYYSLLICIFQFSQID